MVPFIGSGGYPLAIWIPHAAESIDMEKGVTVMGCIVMSPQNLYVEALSHNVMVLVVLGGGLLKLIRVR